MIICCVKMKEEAVALLRCSGGQKQTTRHVVFNQESNLADRNALASAPHLRMLVSTHEEGENQSQEEAQADQHERNLDDYVLDGDHPPQLLGRRVVDQRALSGQR